MEEQQKQTQLKLQNKGDIHSYSDEFPDFATCCAIVIE